jgi:hypothetical protein
MLSTFLRAAGPFLAALGVVVLAAPGVPAQDNPYAAGPGQGQAPPRQDNPPLSRVYSGEALNTRLAEAQALQALRVFPPDVTLEAKVVQGLNVTRGRPWGHLGLLLAGKGLRWPEALRASAFDVERKRLDAVLSQATRQAEEGKVRSATVEDLGKGTAGLKRLLDEQVNEVTPSQYIEARRFLLGLDETVRALQGPDVRDYLVATRELAAAKTAAELVKYLADHRLQFAPAPPGREEAYPILYRALADYAGGVGERKAK